MISNIHQTEFSKNKYNYKDIHEFIEFIKGKDGIGDKNKLICMLENKYNLIKARSVYKHDSFNIRFSQSKSNSKTFSNTVLSLSALKGYDNKPFIVCLVTPLKNHMFLANSTLIDKISHSSKRLSVDNIVGSFNGGNIIMELNQMSNEPANFKDLYELHRTVDFDDNLERLVENTHNIKGYTNSFIPSVSDKKIIMSAACRTINFINSTSYLELIKELDGKVALYTNEIIHASKIDNVNLRGRQIENIISSDREVDNSNLLTLNELGDYNKEYPNFNINVDIKSKLLDKGSSPKGYNIDKLLKFLSDEKSVYLIYIIGIDNNDIYTKLMSIFHDDILSATNIVHHWSGINSRGTTQYNGDVIKNVVMDLELENNINLHKSNVFISNLLEL